jgi:hypothetical protein
MSLQIFKYKIHNSILFSLLDIICFKNNNYYIFNNDSFKKGVFNSSISYFIDEIRPFYYISKQKYLNRTLTYNSFTTILRQICNFNKITYTSQIKYDRSDYNIYYYIYFL